MLRHGPQVEIGVNNIVRHTNLAVRRRQRAYDRPFGARYRIRQVAFQGGRRRAGTCSDE
jgi:hypothetical protein